MNAAIYPLLLRRRRMFRLGAESESASDGKIVVATVGARGVALRSSTPHALSGSASRRTLPLRTRAGIAFAHLKEGGGDVMAVTTPQQIMLDGASVPQASRAQRLALSILQGEHLYDVEIGREGFAQDLTNESCGLCGGFFPKVGEVRYSAIFHEHIHVGCVVSASDWAHPLVAFPTKHGCENGWTIGYASEKDDSLALVRCPTCSPDGGDVA